MYSDIPIPDMLFGILTFKRIVFENLYNKKMGEVG